MEAGSEPAAGTPAAMSLGWRLGLTKVRPILVVKWPPRPMASEPPQVSGPTANARWTRRLTACLEVRRSR